MANKKTPEAGAPKSNAKLFTMVSLVFVSGAHVAALFLMMSAFHLSLFGLHFNLYHGGLIGTGILIGFSLLAVLGLLKASDARHKAHTASIEAVKGEVEAAIKENNAKLSAAMSDVEKKIDQFLGESHTRLEKENEKMRAELDELQKSGVEDTNAEIATLRLENSNLQEMITQWAINSVDERVKMENASLEVA